jgi:hypothetical protein
MPSPKFDPTINLGHILTALTMLIAGAAAWSSINSALAQHEIRIATIERKETEIQALAFRMQTAEAIINNHTDTLTRGRAERLEFQRASSEIQAKILEQLGQIREDLAAIRASQPRAAR